jgi:hypothetical protein
MSVGLPVVWALASNTDPPVLACRGCHCLRLPVRTLCQCAAGAAAAQCKRPGPRPRYERRAGLVQARQPRRPRGPGGPRLEQAASAYLL